MSETAAVPDVVPQISKDKKKVSQSYLSLVWWKFRRNRLAVIGAIILLIYYITCIFFAEFFAPYSKDLQSEYIEARPTYFQFRDDAGIFSLRPFVYGLKEEIDLKTRTRLFANDTTINMMMA